jgi:hypothetical protein
MLLVEKSAHLGILRSKSKEKTEAIHIEQNITKARRTASITVIYGLFDMNL